MTTAFIVINALITIAALVLCIRAWRGLRAVSNTQPRTGANLSPLERRREALELATKAWLYSVEHGLTVGESQERKVMERLEREVSAMENELFGTKEEATPKPEAPKRKHVTTVRRRRNEAGGLRYKAQCAACSWSRVSFSVKTAVEKSVEHEGTHA